MTSRYACHISSGSDHNRELGVVFLAVRFNKNCGETTAELSCADVIVPYSWLSDMFKLSAKDAQCKSVSKVLF